ncbi:Uncharacterized protein OS=Burkholderia pseudomallei MSHR2990 GN=Y046_2082 PE=4 SV=1: YjzC [Gemmata massiliana]|uniref:YjzC family protein n=1 Tax=Gemmata massiliana TaxID=1210884 RepID=A0A6P2DML3_9BACT|nr:Uncharacterized protein OS=Burkholderia pseudomallei MSHR2990 GN=Y046_2082 PE=4 SV=1: YjzC [Gemmata massiliana]
MASTREYKPGEQVPCSGIYRVTHDTRHTQPHEVTCVKGEPFPPCNHCGVRPRFLLARAASHIGNHNHFKR